MIRKDIRLLRELYGGTVRRDIDQAGIDEIHGQLGWFGKLTVKAINLAATLAIIPLLAWLHLCTATKAQLADMMAGKPPGDDAPIPVRTRYARKRDRAEAWAGLWAMLLLVVASGAVSFAVFGIILDNN